MKRRLRFSILAAAEQKRASFGRSRRMIAGMAGRVRRLCFSDTRQDAAALTPSDSCAATGGAICNATAMTDMRFLTRMKRDEGPWTLVHCWSHLRRRFVKLVRNTKSPIAETAVRHIAALYAIEADVRGHAPEARLAARKKFSAPIVEALKPWFEKQLSLISSGSTLAGDIRYALSHWAGLTRFLEDGRLELDTNPVENAIRPVALTRKNALFAGNEVGAENWALLASIVATCKLNNVDPVAYITKTLQAILNGHPQSRVEELMPWNFHPASSLAA